MLINDKSDQHYEGTLRRQSSAKLGLSKLLRPVLLLISLKLRSHQFLTKFNIRLSIAGFWEIFIERLRLSESSSKEGGLRYSNTIGLYLPMWEETIYSLISHELIETSPSQICVDLRLVKLAHIMVGEMPSINYLDI